MAATEMTKKSDQRRRAARTAVIVAVVAFVIYFGMFLVTWLIAS